ncbi:MAG: ligand-binding protein SH3 [Bacteroidetes bacterium RIFCSPLOWO2_12_FULL_31_6]|nr:MAG: ligand-binding protein SH3 [Bacteroidetes bacterium RIFCSPLOWO2_12_FULL_31_6]
MIYDIFFTFLLSISPLGEARVGIPYGIINDLHPILAFVVGTIANLLIFPLLIVLINFSNKKLWNVHFYRKHVVKLARRSKKLMGENINKYGIWGLMVFVMIPLPGTGAYMGTIASSILNLNRRESFVAVSVGVIISSIVIATGTHFSMLGIEMF